MDMRFDTEQDFEEFKSEIKKRLSTRGFSTLDLPEFRSSAVAILIMNRDGEAHVFLTKRTDRVGTHKGEVSFPGGAHEESDIDIMHTALRETWEEAGIRPEDVEVLGRFDDYFSIRRFHVATLVGVIPGDYDYKLNDDEIEECLDAPLALFYNKDYDRVENIEYDGKNVNIYYYLFEGFSIWGLTARILTEFSEKILAG